MKLTRKHVMSITLMILLSTVMGIVITAMLVLWLPILLIRPTLLAPLSDMVMRKMTQVMMGVMFPRIKQSPTMPMEDIKE